MAEKWHLNWEEYEAMVRQMTARIALCRPSGHIRGIPRGGLVAAVMASHELRLPYHGEFELDNNNDTASDPLTEQSILIDDILDTGNTLINILRSLNFGRPQIVAVVIAKPQGIAHWQSFLVNHLSTSERPRLIVGHLYEGPEWVVFPYENQETEAPDDSTNL